MGSETVIVAFIGAFGSALSAFLARGARSEARKASESVGPANGRTLRELLEHIIAFEEYQHTRNHDILNALTALRLEIATLKKERK